MAFRQNIPRFIYFMANLFAFLLPLSKKIVVFVIILWLILWLIEGGFKNKFKSLLSNYALLLLPAFYLLHVAGVLYSENTDSALFDLEVKLSILIFPILISGTSFEKARFKIVLLWFVAGNMLSFLICFSNSLVKYFENYDYYMLIYYNISIFHHTSYASLYNCLSIAILVYLLADKFFSKRVFKIIMIVAIFIFILNVYLMSSRAGIIAMFAWFVFTLIYFIIKYKKYLISGILFIAMVLVMFLILKINTRMNMLYHEMGKNISEVIKDPSTYRSDDRLAIWYNAVSLIKSNHFYGSGNGDVKNDLEEQYKISGLQILADKKYNAHNQYLETTIGVGFFGLFLLLLVLIWPLYKKRNYVLYSFIVLVFVNFLFESMLNTQAGVTFFAFFYALLIRSDDHADLVSLKTQE